MYGNFLLAKEIVSFTLQEYLSFILQKKILYFTFLFIDTVRKSPQASCTENKY